jgi:molybdopterin converting factor small subunit
MNVTVHLLGQLRTAAGTAVAALALEAGATVVQLVCALASRHGPALSHLLLDGEDRLRPTILIFVGDEQVEGNDTVSLHEGAVVTLLTPIAGGVR